MAVRWFAMGLDLMGCMHLHGWLDPQLPQCMRSFREFAIMNFNSVLVSGWGDEVSSLSISIGFCLTIHHPANMIGHALYGCFSTNKHHHDSVLECQQYTIFVWLCFRCFPNPNPSLLFSSLPHSSTCPTPFTTCPLVTPIPASTTLSMDTHRSL